MTAAPASPASPQHFSIGSDTEQSVSSDLHLMQHNMLHDQSMAQQNNMQQDVHMQFDQSLQYDHFQQFNVSFLDETVNVTNNILVADPTPSFCGDLR